MFNIGIISEYFLNKSIWIHLFRFSLFKEHLRPLYEEHPQALKKMHAQLLEQLKQNVAVSFSTLLTLEMF